jgi:hypothetical protein
MSEKIVVYLIVHELFGVLFNGKKMTLVTPVVKPHTDSGGHVHEHKYKVSRFKDGKWHHEVDMVQNEVYRLQGVKVRTAVATNIPCHSEFSPHPPGKFELNSSPKPFCTWELPLPKQIHQLRLVSIPECERPVFLGDPHGDAVETQLNAISLVHAFEYEGLPGKDVKITDESGHPLKLDYKPDKTTRTINLHLWAQLEDESGMNEKMANEHAAQATDALVALFKGLVMHGTRSLSIDNFHTTQVRMPPGIRFPELMTLAEKFTMLGNRLVENIECTGKTCGHGGNLYVSV